MEHNHKLVVLDLQSENETMFIAKMVIDMSQFRFIPYVSKYYRVILNITNFAIISLVSRNTITSVAVNSIQTNSSILTRIRITVIFIYNNITKRLRMFNKLISKKGKVQRCDQSFNKNYNE